jgi:hypothetical protein
VKFPDSVPCFLTYTGFGQILWILFDPTSYRHLRPTEYAYEKGVNMDIFLVKRFVDEVFPLVLARYRFMDQRWWVSQDGFWTKTLARERVIDDLIVLAGDSSIRGQSGDQIRSGVHKAHVINQILGMLSTRLTTRIGLPARIVLSPSQAGLAYALPAPAARSEPGQPSPPAPLPAPEPAEPVDQGDTASPTGHTP